jgi:hypothetical protein
MASPLNEFSLLENLKDQEKFIGIIFAHYESEAAKSYLKFVISEDRIRDAHILWTRDVNRISEREYEGGELDQYKLAGYLCFWLRRAAPIIGTHRGERMGQLSGGNDVIDELLKEQGFIGKYGNEYLAFDIGFKVCRNIEIWRVEGKRRYPVLKQKFLNDLCEVLKTRSVSPQALYMIYHAIFDAGERFSYPVLTA